MPTPVVHESTREEPVPEQFEDAHEEEEGSVIEKQQQQRDEEEEDYDDYDDYLDDELNDTDLWDNATGGKISVLLLLIPGLERKEEEKRENKQCMN